MKMFTATELRNKTGQFIEAILKEPVAIQKSGRSVAVVLPQEEYDRLIALDDAICGKRAEAALAEGFASEEEISELMEKYKRA